MRGRLRNLSWVALVFVFALVASACGGGTTEDDGGEPGAAGTDGATATTAAAGGDTLVVGSLEVPSGLDPAYVYELFASTLLYNTTNRLVEFPAGETEVGPGLATDWTVSDDGLTYTFNLREGVTFHDGSEMTAEDVVWSLNRSININHPDAASFLIDGIESVEAPDDMTVEITLSEPNVTFLSRLNYTVASILPEGSDTYPEIPQSKLGSEEEPPAVEEAEEYLNNSTVVGTGPYEMTEYRPGESVTLERYDDYWGEPAKIETVQIQFFEEPAQMKNALEAGEIDLNVGEFDATARNDLDQAEGVTVFQGPGAVIRYLVVDTNQVPLEVRQALSAALDRQRLVDEVLEGGGKPLFSMIPDLFPSQNEEPIQSIDTQLDEPYDLELWYPLNKYFEAEQSAEVMRRILEESGNFNVTINSADWASEYSQNLRSGAYPVYMLGWYPDYFDPDDYISPFYVESGYALGYSNQQMADLIRQEQTTQDEAEREQIFDQIQQVAAEDMPYIPLYQLNTYAYYGDNLTGVEQTIDEVQQTRYWLIGKSE